jgi:hypothetical protein
LGDVYLSSFSVILVAKAGMEPGTFGTLKIKNNKMFPGIRIIRSREMRQTEHVACI